MKNFEIPKFADKQELFKFIVDNENLIIAQKKSIIKEADGFHAAPILGGLELNPTNKDQVEDLIARPSITTKIVINTSNVFDSHKDLHVPGLWDKSMNENRNPFHLQEHSRKFKDIISNGSDLKAYVENFTWKQLGYNMPGKTQALMFDSNIKKTRNAYMHEQYAKGYVTNHSVGMMYVKMSVCINDEDYPVQKENWDKYYPMGANKELADEWGYFFAQTEAKYIEGSAVPMGSNQFTPTVETKHTVETDSELKAKAIKEWLLK